MWKAGGRRNPITFSKLLEESVYFFFITYGHWKEKNASVYRGY